MNGNHEPEGELRKMCPLLNGWCIGDACAMRPQLQRIVNGVHQTFRACWVDALVILLSEINAKTPPPPMQKIQLPGILRR